MSGGTQAVNENLAALTAAGTSVWLDQIRRSMIEGGELQRMVDEDSLRGVTSNPAIFEKAILGSPDYDEELAAGARDGLSARELYRRIAVRDVRLAADVLRPVHESNGGADGFVSLEVAPRLAHDTEGTLEQARQYWELVDRPNLMIKIPATDAGIPAIEEALYEGMHVNVTLLFSVAAYRKVMDAYIRAMERRLADGRPLDRHSVASFFVSRVDTEVDKRLEAIGRPELAGRAGLANARAAYRAYQEVFGGERFAALRDAGCPPQRPLWASTGVKNPHYPETMYVDGLAGPETVNTMPLPTLLAVAECGRIEEGSALIDPRPDLRALAEAGIDLDDVTAQLLREGIDAFVTPMNKLLDGIERRREAVVTGRPQTLEADLPPELERPLAERVRAAQEADVARRIWRKDATLWAPEGTPEIANRLGWLTIADKMLEDADALREFAAECRADGLTDCVLLGMGGSSLAPEVFRLSYGEEAGGLRLHVLDSTEPLQIAAVTEAIDLDSTLFLVSTKSGGTIETRTLFEHFHGLEPDGAHFAAITDPGSSLLELAGEHGFRRAFVNDPDIGGRYSALSYFGLVPAALAGIDIDAVLQASEVAEQNCADYQEPDANSGLWLGVALGELALRGRDKLTFVVDGPVSSFGVWVE
ncbi:MAG: bifunctional transaldolase/phosoglucose isomerase, partial [Actinomycetota bacterium]|nr:bifunctional transaldolase/phosoglucose isomerase [Actinomycetota bacterium]